MLKRRELLMRHLKMQNRQSEGEIVMNNVDNDSAKNEIRFSTLFVVFKKFLWILIVVTLLGGIVGGLSSAFMIKTKYSAKIEFVVVNVLDENPYISDSMLGAASDITNTCVEIVNKNVLLSRVVEERELDKALGCTQNEAVEKISSMISAEKISDDSSVFSVKVVSLDPNVSFKIVSAIQEVMPSVVEDLYKLSDSSSITTTLKPVTVVNNIYDVVENNPSVLKYSVIFAVLGFVMTYVICFVIFMRDNKVYDESTVKENFDVPVLGAIPEWGTDALQSHSYSQRRHLYASNEKRNYENKIIGANTPFAVTEAFNALRSNICYSVADESCPVFAITSDFSGAGKSVISANIAVSLSLLGKKTLLIEGDLRRPEISHIFNKKAEFGLSDYLSGEVRDKSLVATDVGYENLDVVFSGKIPPNPAELLGSEKMASYIKQCKQEYDIIIIDTPPSAEVSDVGIISSFSTGIIVVARSRYSDVNAIKDTCELVGGVGGKIVGFVVNDINYKVGSNYQNKKYGYGKYYKKYQSSGYSSSYKTDGTK